MKSVHFGDRPYTLPHEDWTQGTEVEKEGGKEVQRRGRGEGRREREGGKGDSRGRGGTEIKEGGKGERESRGRRGTEIKVTGRVQGGEGRRERGSAVTVAGTGRLQSSLEYTRPPRGSDTLAGCDSPATGSAAVVQQDSSFNTWRAFL